MTIQRPDRMPVMERQAIVAYVPWSIFTLADDIQAQENHGQTLYRLCERSGVSICELVAILEHRPWRQMTLSEAWDRLWQISTQRSKENHHDKTHQP